MKPVARVSERGYTKNRKRNVFGKGIIQMRRRSKFLFSLVLTAAVLAGTVAAGCSQGTDYTAEIRDYQDRLEAMAQENEALQERVEELERLLGGSVASVTEETAETESADGSAAFSSETVETTAPESAAETESEETEEKRDEDDVTRILVFGDSIWGNYRDDTGIAARVEQYMKGFGRDTVVYNAAIGGTRATLDYDDSPWTYGPGNDASLPMMLSILDGKTDLALLEGKAAHDVMAEVMEIKDQIDYVILAYGMNDFLAQVPLNDSDYPKSGYGTALVFAAQELKRILPQAQGMVISPTFASYFPIPVQNQGDRALFNYAKVVRMVGTDQDLHLLCMDAYNELGIDPYNAEDYIEDGIHLNARGRELYAQHVVSCLMFGTPGQVSENSYNFNPAE